ncbi:FAD/NAD(P)-binding domain-containing protein [Testicularia cyperi]|uniref:L-ornithine N(5)-monooxygenase [NAD(P)H] n=1 Tax=Testicularia cyperi TaxID=1882483 RepID=A0A317XFM8_9BASI|nr:FAD/NAD(P)-binding domain-containing protein [Testicularia cyperi]
MSLPPTTQPTLTPQYHDVVIVGGGLSGMCVACQLKRRFNITDVKILEKEDGLAGTWKVNTYPGCGCDVPAPVYSYSFRTKGDWSTFYPEQNELRQYFETVAAEHNLRPNFHFQTTVKEARFDNDTGLWHIWSEDWKRDSKEPGEKHHYVCKLFISAVGGLSQPKECDIAGHETFKGPIFHSARWDHSVELKGKDVIVVGNGCSATQFVPRIAPQTKSLTQIVRSAHWIAPHPHNPFDKIPGFKWLLQKSLFVRKLHRFLIWCVLESHFSVLLLNPIGRFSRWWWRTMCVNHVKKNAPKEYWNLLIPDQKKVLVGCKRRILDDEYLPVLRQPHVKLDGTKLERIEERHVVMADGRRLKADVIIMANGFATQRAGHPMEIYGARHDMRTHWKKYGGGGPINYRSSLNATFPNMGQLVAANSATGHMSVIFTTECQVNFILEIAKPVLAAPRPAQVAIDHVPGTPASEQVKRARIPTFEVKLKAELDEQHWIAKAMSKLVFTSGCKSWYIDPSSGRVTVLYPDWQVNFMIRSTFPKWADLQYTGLKNGLTRPDTVPWWKVLGDKLGLGHVSYVDPKDTPEIDRKSMDA